jgi:hypothetical protein
VWPILHLRLGAPKQEERRPSLKVHPYLFRFLPVFAVWSFVTGVFVPFAPIFFNKRLGLPLQSVGAIFSATQMVQAFIVLVTPLLYRKAGVMAGILCAQVVTCAAIIALYFGHSVHFLVGAYLVFTAAQFGASPGFYNLIMSRVPEAERSSASAAQNLTGSLVQAGSAAFAGWLIVRQGYSSLFAVNTGFAVIAVLFSAGLLRRERGAGAGRGVDEGMGAGVSAPST